MTTANATYDYGSAGLASLGLLPGEGRPTIGELSDGTTDSSVVWRRKMQPQPEGTLVGFCTEYNFQILAEKLIGMGYSPDQKCRRRKGYGCRSIIVGRREFMLTGGRFFSRDLGVTPKMPSNSGRVSRGNL